MASSAFAADLPVKAPPMPAPVLYSWSGLYIGGHVGGGWSDNAWADPTVGFAGIGDVDGDGFLGGGQIGFNWQWNNIVLGLEAQFSASDINGSSTFGTPGVAALTLSNDINWITSVTGRLGFTANNWLLFVKGGAAWADFDAAATVDTLGVLTTSTVSDDRLGWTIGAGAEWGFAPNWSVLVEYQYYDFGDETYGFFPPAAIPATVDTDIHTVKVGLNYRLGGLLR
jgi:outer membrane immunogenic protein